MGKRRGHGEGAIYQRADGRWCSSVDLGYANGKRRRKIVYGKTRKEVADKLKTLHRQANVATPDKPEPVSVASYLDYWLENSARRRNKPRTANTYERLIELYIKPAIGRYQLDKLTRVQVQDVVNDLAVKKSPYTVRNVRAIIRRALAQAITWGKLQENVATSLEMPRIEQEQIRPLTIEEVHRLLRATSGHPLDALIRLALSLGLRRGEVCGLRWQDVDLEQGVLRVTGTLDRWGGKVQRSTPKTKASTRTLLLPSQLVAMLKEHRDRQEKERTTSGEQWNDTGYVFTTSRGTPYEPRNVFRSFKALVDKAGLPSITRFHDLRHSAASLLLAQGVPISVVSDILGHSSIHITKSVYGHVYGDAQRAALGTIGTLFEDNSGEKK